MAAPFGIDEPLYSYEYSSVHRTEQRTCALFSSLARVLYVTLYVTHDLLKVGKGLLARDPAPALAVRKAYLYPLEK